MIWAVMILGVLADRITKILAAGYLPYEVPVPIIGNIFSLEYIHNKGAAWSILDGRVGLLLIITVAVTIFIAWLLHKTPKEQKFMRFSYALLISGALGNIIDRVYYGYVIDFLRFPNFPVFNIADCCVTVGIALIIILTIKDMIDESKNNKNNKKPAQNGKKAKQK